jgi:hypothetical protein
MTLVVSVLPFIGFSVLLVVLVTIDRRNDKKVTQRNKECLEPVAKFANGLYEERYGEPSEELVKAFPELKVVK